MSTPRKFYITFHVGPHSGNATRTLEGHRQQLAHLQEMERRRKENAPTHWGRTDDWYAAEMSAIETLVASIGRGDVPPPHICEQ